MPPLLPRLPLFGFLCTVGLINQWFHLSIRLNRLRSFLIDLNICLQLLPIISLLLVYLFLNQFQRVHCQRVSLSEAVLWARNIFTNLPLIALAYSITTRPNQAAFNCLAILICHILPKHSDITYEFACFISLSLLIAFLLRHCHTVFLFKLQVILSISR